MITNHLKEKIDQKKPTLGTFFECGSSLMLECMAYAGLDYVIIDTEHGPFEPESVADFVCAANGMQLTPLVRVKDVSRPAILKVLDVGAQGLIIPQVQSMEDIRKAVEYGKYYPLGSRGVAGVRANGLGYGMGGSLKAWFENSNSQTLLIPQCETLGCLKDIENIARADGVAGIFIGPYDLSTAMGIPGQFTCQEFLQAVDRIIKASHEAGKFCMIYADSGTKAKEYFARDADSVTISQDGTVMAEGYKRMIADAL